MPPDPTFHPPRQARSRETLARIVNAARELLRDTRADDLTVQAIVARSGTSVGSFYARFGGKDDLLRHLAQRVRDEAREQWDTSLASGAWDELDLQGVIRGVVRAVVTLDEEKGELLRGAAHLPGGDDADAAQDPAASVPSALLSHLRSGARELLLARRREMGHPDPAAAVELSLSLLLSLLGSGGLTRAREDRGSGPLTDELTRLLSGYLTAEAPGQGPQEAVDFFDVWA